MRAELEIATDPLAWPVIAGTGGVRKARAARGAKSVREDIDESQKKSIRALVAELEREAG